MTETFPDHPTADGAPARPGTLPASSARYGAFTDAVVAIALTLLILPLLEASSGLDPRGGTTLAYLRANAQAILSFLISFAVIGMFWFLHHRVFRADTPHSGALALVNLAWMATIVFMPVTSAVTGRLDHTDRVGLALYVGTMALSSWLMLLLTVLQLRARRRAGLPMPNRTILAAPAAMSVLFSLAMLIGLVAPQLTYFPLLLMLLTGLLRRLLVRLGLRDRHPDLAGTS